MMRFPVASSVPLWDLAGGLAFALMVSRGPRLFPLVAMADLASNLTASGPHPPLIALACSALAVAGCYAPAAVYLRRFGTSAPRTQADLFRLIVVSGVAAFARSAGDLLVLGLWGGVEGPAYLTTLARGWSGAFIGVIAVTPLLDRPKPPWAVPAPRTIGEVAVQLALLAGCMALIFPNHGNDRFRYFYLLFVPQIWIAVRFGAAGAALGNLAVQSGLIAFLLSKPESESVMFNYDIRLMALMLSTLFLGCAVSERRGAEAALRQRQDQLARVSRLSLAGEMAAALAHELNQPLLATIAFTRAAQRFMARGEAERDDAMAAMNDAVIQAERAGEIVRTLRGFIGRGESERRPNDLANLARDATLLAEPECAKLGVRIVTAIDKALPPVQSDAVQIQQVLLNLIQNALDALDRPHLPAKLILLSARQVSDREIEVEVRDTGPGLPPVVEARLFEPFSSEKANGMGLGLVISRGIVESHGGRLWLADNQPGRCVFRFSLPVARGHAKVTSE